MYQVFSSHFCVLKTDGRDDLGYWNDTFISHQTPELWTWKCLAQPDSIQEQQVTLISIWLPSHTHIQNKIFSAIWTLLVFYCAGFHTEGSGGWWGEVRFPLPSSLPDRVLPRRCMHAPVARIYISPSPLFWLFAVVKNRRESCYMICVWHSWCHSF